MVSVLVVYKQIGFIQTKNLGYDKNNIISFKREGRLNESLETFLQEVKNMPGVVNASCFGHDLLGDHGGTSGLDWEGKRPDENIQFGNLEVDYEWFETLDIEMAAGRTFSREFGSDSAKIIFNEAAIAAENKLFFISNQPLSGSGEKKDIDIWYVEKDGKGGLPPSMPVTSLIREKANIIFHSPKPAPCTLPPMWALRKKINTILIFMHPSW